MTSVSTFSPPIPSCLREKLGGVWGWIGKGVISFPFFLRLAFGLRYNVKEINVVIDAPSINQQ